MSLRLPLVVILGATGSGKTKLSLELAKRFNGEIIGADSMQVYKALDIITAKASKDELNSARHHLINILEPFDTYMVTDYRNEAVSVIDNIFKQNKLPIVVGGTNYYVESILWRILIDNPQSSTTILVNQYDDLTNEELHHKLKTFDPIMAGRLHPNNRRKVLRSLEICEQTGKRKSDILNEQQQADGGSKFGGGLRYKTCLIFWLLCNQITLDERLNKRVDEMLENGLLDELSNFHKLYREKMISSDVGPDYTKGIFQSIGFKEFHDFLMLNEDDKKSEQGNILLNKGVEELKMVTRRLARRQKKWITKRFLSNSDRNVPPLYGLNTDDVLKWNERVSEPAISIIESYINDMECQYDRMPFQESHSKPNIDDRTYKCEECDRIFIGDYQWEEHRKSRKHRLRLAKLKKLRTINNIRDINVTRCKNEIENIK